MTPEAVEAVEEIEAIAAGLICTSSIDEEAAILAFHPYDAERYKDGPMRPAQSLEDSSGYPIGAGLVRMRTSLEEYKLLGSFSAGLTITQMQQHPMEQSLWAQLGKTRCWKKSVGRFPLLNWTDHAQLARMCMLASEPMEPKLWR